MLCDSRDGVGRGSGCSAGAAKLVIVAAGKMPIIASPVGTGGKLGPPAVIRVLKKPADC